MTPAQQRLEPHDAAVAALADRLIEQEKLFFPKACIEVELEHAAGEGAALHIGAEQPHKAASLGFRAVEGEISFAQERVFRLALGGRERDAAASAGNDAMVSEIHRSLDGRDDIGREPHRGAFLRAVQDQREFVAAKAGERRIRGDPLPDAPGHLAQQRIAKHVAQCVVDRLEIIEVEQKQRDGTRIAAHRRRRAV